MGCRGYGHFILGDFLAGHITWCTDKMLTDKILGDKTPVKISRGDKKFGGGKKFVLAMSRKP